LVNPPHAQRCDCGYEFVTGAVRDSPLTDKDRAAQPAPHYVVVPGGCFGLLVLTLGKVILYGSGKLGLLVVGTSLLLTIPIAGASGLGFGGYLGVWGLLIVTLDIGIRKFYFRGPLLDVSDVSKFVFVPAWVFGTCMFLFGASLVLAERVM
jgi:hypothetical protein